MTFEIPKDTEVLQIDITEVKKQIRAEVIDEYKSNLLNGELYRCTDGNEYVDVADVEYVAEQLKEQK